MAAWEPLYTPPRDRNIRVLVRFYRDFACFSVTAPREQKGSEMDPTWCQKEAKWYPKEPQGRQLDPKESQKRARWSPKRAKGSPKGAKRQPNGVRGSGVKTKEIECDIVLKHEGGKLGSPLLL